MSDYNWIPSVLEDMRKSVKDQQVELELPVVLDEPQKVEENELEERGVLIISLL